MELDLQITKDGHLVTNHDPFLKETTDIEEYKDKYADRMGGWDYRPLYGNVYTNDWLIHNFTLAELKQLRRKQRYAFRNTDLDEFFQIMTLEEVIEQMFDLHKKHPNPDRQFPIGLYIETKMYAFYLQQYNIDIAEMLFNVLKKYNLETVDKCKNIMPIIIECFEGDALKKFGTLSDLPLIRLMNEYDGDAASALLPQVATYAHGIGPRQLLLKSETFWQMSQYLQLQVHPWTLQDDIPMFTKDVVDEYMWYFNRGVQGIFIEFPHTAKALIDKHF